MLQKSHTTKLNLSFLLGYRTHWLGIVTIMRMAIRRLLRPEKALIVVSAVTLVAAAITFSPLVHVDPSPDTILLVGDFTAGSAVVNEIQAGFNSARNSRNVAQRELKLKIFDEGKILRNNPENYKGLLHRATINAIADRAILGIVVASTSKTATTVMRVGSSANRPMIVTTASETNLLAQNGLSGSAVRVLPDNIAQGRTIAEAIQSKCPVSPTAKPMKITILFDQSRYADEIVMEINGHLQKASQTDQTTKLVVSYEKCSSTPTTEQLLRAWSSRWIICVGYEPLIQSTTMFIEQKVVAREFIGRRLILSDSAIPLEPLFKNIPKYSIVRPIWHSPESAINDANAVYKGEVVVPRADSPVEITHSSDQKSHIQIPAKFNLSALPNGNSDYYRVVGSAAYQMFARAKEKNPIALNLRDAYFSYWTSPERQWDAQIFLFDQRGESTSSRWVLELN